MVKLRLKRLLCIAIISLSVSGCLTSSKTLPKEAEEVRVYWGSKEECINFLGSPSAKAERWLCEALGK